MFDPWAYLPISCNERASLPVGVNVKLHDTHTRARAHRASITYDSNLHTAVVLRIDCMVDNIGGRVGMIG